MKELFQLKCKLLQAKSVKVNKNNTFRFSRIMINTGEITSLLHQTQWHRVKISIFALFKQQSKVVWYVKPVMANFKTSLSLNVPQSKVYFLEA